MSHQTEYDLRMRSYKSITDTHLIPRTPVIIQIDGRAFHTFTRGFKKPFDQVLMVGEGEDVKVGAPTVAGATVEASVVENGKAKKVIVYKYKRKTGYHKKNGHRQQYTAVKIEKINA